MILGLLHHFIAFGENSTRQPYLVLRDERFQHLTFLIDGTPEIVLHAVDLDENLIEAPLSLT